MPQLLLGATIFAVGTIWGAVFVMIGQQTRDKS